MPAFSEDDFSLQQAIQQNLHTIADQLGHPLEPKVVQQIYHETASLLEQVNPQPLTLARVAGALLVYQLQPTEAEELQWFKTQLRDCQDEEAVEELVESISRIDGL